MKKKIVATIKGVEYSVKDLVDSLKASDEEAQNYMDQLTPLREENRRLNQILHQAKSNRMQIGLILGFIEVDK